MAVTVKAEVKGGKEALKTLRRIDPEARKQFLKDAKKIADPIISAAKDNYPAEALSGMSRNWRTKQGRELFPYSQAKARRNVQLKLDTRARSGGLIKVVQKDVAASIYEVAGRKNPGSAFNARLSAKTRRPSRALWPAAETNLGKVQAEMLDALREVERLITRELER